MRITRTTRAISFLSSFIIGGILMSRLAIGVYEKNRDFPIQSTVLFDGIEQVLIFIIAFILGGVWLMLVAHLVFKKISK